MIDYLLTLIGARKKQVYCQECGRDITGMPGDVTDSKVYCHGDRPCEDGGIGETRCSINAFARNLDLDDRLCMITNTYGPTKIQLMIRSGELKGFGPLEKAAKG